MDGKIYDFKLCNKNDKLILVEDINIPIPNFIKRSIKKYRIIVIDDTIFLQRKCILCNEFFSVQIFESGEFKNIENSKVRYIGVKSGFHTKCTSCENTALDTNNIILNSNSAANDTTTQLNIVVNQDLKKFFKLLSINNNTSLRHELQTALNFYKDYINKDN